jgi:phenylpropionate dioxygenase-like ring-hydroxylating dioxygenase large terminal subunit
LKSTRKPALPASTYIDPGWFELEKRHIFSRNWRCVVQVFRIPRSGDYLTDSIVDQPIFVLCCADGPIVAFHNAGTAPVAPLPVSVAGEQKIGMTV